MRSFSRMSVAAKMLAGLTLVVLLFGSVSAVLVSRLASRALLDQAALRGITMTAVLAARAEEPLLAVDFLRLSDMVRGLQLQDPGVSYAFILDEGGQVLAHTFDGGFPVELATVNPAPARGQSKEMLLDTGAERVSDFAAPVMVAGQRLGEVHVGLSRTPILAARHNLLLAISGVSAGVGMLALALGGIFARTLTRRVDAVRAAAEEMVKGNLDVQARPESPNQDALACWEARQCDLRNCPAHGDRKRRCWYMAGDLGQPAPLLGKHNRAETCRECPVYRATAGDEIDALAEAFDVMAVTLKVHIDQLQTAQENLTRQERILRTIFDVTPDLVSLQDEHLVYRAVNKAFCRFFSLNEEDVLGRTDEDIFSPEQSADNLEEDNRILENGLPLSKQILIKRGESARWFHILKVPVFDHQRIVGLLLTARDISVIKRYQEQLIQSQKMEDLGRLAGGVAHEINTPLGIILGYSQLLLEDLGDGPEREEAEIIEKQAQVCRKIVADLLKFSRNMDSSWEEVDLNHSLQEVVNVVRPIFQQERVRVETEFDPDMPPVRGDADKLRQVWMNLVNNAYDAMGQDGTIVLRTKLCAHRRRVVVTVTDTGPGISPEHMSRVFEPFFSTKPPGKGTGLGLAVSFGIIQDHKGRINVLSPAPVEYMGAGAQGQRPPGPGTVFVVELPLTEEGLPEEECEEVWEQLRGEA